MSKGQPFITTLQRPQLRRFWSLTLLICSLSAALPEAQAQSTAVETAGQLNAPAEPQAVWPETVEAAAPEAAPAIPTEQQALDTPPLVDPSASEELLSDPQHPDEPAPATEMAGASQTAGQQEVEAPESTQPQSWYSAWFDRLELDEESKKVVFWGTVLAILAVPFLPFLVLQSLASSDTEVAFANDMEMGTYLIACLLLPIGAALLFNAKGILLLALGVVLVTFSTVLLLSLLGLQRQLSRNLLTTCLMFVTKISYFILTFVLAVAFRTLALLLFKQSYDDAKNREYVRAGLMLGGGAASWRAGGKIIDAMPNYANGTRIPAVAAAFPEDGFWDLIALGFEGYGNRYAYQKRWKSQ